MAEAVLGEVTEGGMDNYEKDKSDAAAMMESLNDHMEARQETNNKERSL